MIRVLLSILMFGKLQTLTILKLVTGMVSKKSDHFIMQVFEGLRVLDFTHVFVGPFAKYQLAVMGAEVIKIEPPDYGLSDYFATLAMTVILGLRMLSPKVGGKGWESNPPGTSNAPLRF